jgi:hypothetical protein
MPLPQIEIDSPTQNSSEKATQYVNGDDLMPPMLDKDGHATGPPIEMVDGEPMPTVGRGTEIKEGMTVEVEEAIATRFVKALHFAATRGRIHDVLQFNNGGSALGVIAWNFMEYLPFRRMVWCSLPPLVIYLA